MSALVGATSVANALAFPHRACAAEFDPASARHASQSRPGLNIGSSPPDRVRGGVIQRFLPRPNLQPRSADRSRASALRGLYCAHTLARLLPLALCAAPAVAQDQAGQQTLDAVVVTATRSRADPFDVPASIDRIDVDTPRTTGIAELLSGVPGVVARDRQNYAQDVQISIRGFGARSSFGIRGVRLYTDGIPATQPDGQGQVSHFNLDSAERIEVLRGPFSALYGNASGGVVQVFTADGADPPETRVGATLDSLGTRRGYVNLRGSSASFDHNLGYSVLRADGDRSHARAQRHSLNSKLGLALPANARLTLLANLLDQPLAQDPLGLTREQVREDPRQAAPAALQFDTRKRLRQGQAGAIYARPLGSRDRLQLMAYAGSRDVVQFLSVPVAAQAAPGSAGGVVDLDSGYGGTDLRWTRAAEWHGWPIELSLGAAFDVQRQLRRGYENFVGDTLGVRGRLRRDQADRVSDADQYAQLDWRLSQRWSVLAGARHSRVELRSHDRFVAPGNPDDSGRVRFDAWTPVAGATWRASQALNLYASYGRGFETPTLSEVGYRADGGSGLALDLRPVRSDNVEVGGKWRSPRLQAQLALFDTRSDDELAVATSSGGRTTFQNIGQSRRRGGELSLAWQWTDAWRTDVAYTALDARFASAFLACSARCAAPDTPVAAGGKIPGVPQQTASLGLRWQRGEAWSAGFDARYSGAVLVDDLGSQSAPAYTLLGAQVARRWARSQGDVRTFLRLDNLTGRRYVGSVIVNEGNGRYYEPGPGRSVQLGVEWRARE